jgi:dUTP pyrophosphatase
MRKFEIINKFREQNPIIPKRATEGSAGYDLSSIEDVTIMPQEIRLIPTGLKVLMPKNEALFVFPRSSLAIKRGLMMSNSVGVIDADYYNNSDNEGHIMVPLVNMRNEPVKILKGERIAQGIFLQYQKTTDDETENITRLGGFGSSGH